LTFIGPEIFHASSSDLPIARGVAKPVILAFADPYRVGHSVLALILLRVEALAHDDLVDAITSYPEVTYVSSLIGRADVYAQVICRDNEHLWELVNKRLRGLNGVIETETMMEMKVHKFIFHLLP
jgi:Lrp/AsnC family transcriptional regulator for asnA, asnC and gidA